MLNKNNHPYRGKRSFRLAPLSYVLLLLCLCIHILYNSFLLFCVYTDIINATLLQLQITDFLESQLLSLLVAVIGTLLFDLELKR